MRNSGRDSVIKYAALGDTQVTDASGRAGPVRYYIPGFTVGLANAVGPSIVSYYSTGKFLAGTRIRWEPSVSFTTTGRVYVGFTDNPEAARTTSLALYASQVKGLQDMISFPVWQETNVPFPMTMRRKRFDVNASASLSSVDVLDRSCQTAMFAVIDGAPENTVCGSFWHHDQVDVEGIHPAST